MRSALHDAHAARGARFVDFGGWEMPVQYRSVLAEHEQVRTSCGWFDVSHLGRAWVRGAGAEAVLNKVFSNNTESIESGRTQYTLALNASGGIIDDVILWRFADDFLVLPNAGNHERVLHLITDAGVAPVDIRPTTCTVAVQGPLAPDILERVLGVRPRRSRVATARFEEVEVLVGGSGYTGEPGGEVVIAADNAAALVTSLEAAGAGACGLGARDTLRLEAGLPLWGQDIDESTTPYEAGLTFAVDLDHDFAGREALLRTSPEAAAKRLIGFTLDGRQIPRHGYRLRSGGTKGWVTSGNFSPTLQHGIGLGYLEGQLDADLEVEIRGEWRPAQVATLPFYRRK